MRRSVRQLPCGKALGGKRENLQTRVRENNLTTNMQITNGIHKGLADPTYRAIEGLSQSAMKSLMRSPGHFKHQQENPREGTPAMERLHNF